MNRGGNTVTFGQPLNPAHPRVALAHPLLCVQIQQLKLAIEKLLI